MPYDCGMSKQFQPVVDAAKHLGSVSALASSLGVQPPTVHQWCNGARPVPIEKCVAIERATSGAVTREDLRPDDWQSIWPELAARKSKKAEA